MSWFGPLLPGSAQQQATPPAGVESPGGLHAVECGAGDIGNGTVPQTLHTIDLGVSA